MGSRQLRTCPVVDYCKDITFCLVFFGFFWDDPFYLREFKLYLTWFSYFVIRYPHLRLFSTLSLWDLLGTPSLEPVPFSFSLVSHIRSSSIFHLRPSSSILLLRSSTLFFPLRLGIPHHIYRFRISLIGSFGRILSGTSTGPRSSYLHNQ